MSGADETSRALDLLEIANAEMLRLREHAKRCIDVARAQGRCDLARDLRAVWQSLLAKTTRGELRPGEQIDWEYLSPADWDVAVKKASAVTLRITHCRQCPHLEVGPPYSLDGFDRGSDWRCKLAGKDIAGFVERSSEADAIQIPAFCPLRKRPASSVKGTD